MREGGNRIRNQALTTKTCMRGGGGPFAKVEFDRRAVRALLTLTGGIEAQIEIAQKDRVRPSISGFVG